MHTQRVLPSTVLQATPADSFARLVPEASRTAKTLATGLHSDFAERLKQIDAGLHGNLVQSLKEIDTGPHAHLAQALKGMDTGLLATLKKLEAGSAVALPRGSRHSASWSWPP